MAPAPRLISPEAHAFSPELQNMLRSRHSEMERGGDLNEYLEKLHVVGTLYHPLTTPLPPRITSTQLPFS